MPDLDEQLAAYIDAIAEPVGIEVARAAPTRRSGRVVVAVAAAVLLVGGLVLAVRPADDRRVVTNPTQRSAPDWPTPFGEERPAVVPDGWKVLDVRDIRLAVPAAWPVQLTSQCEEDETGVVRLSFDTPDHITCATADGPPVTTIDLFEGKPYEGGDPPVSIGGLSAVLHDLSPVCGSACRAYRLTGNVDLTAFGPDRDAVLATFTDSGPRRALQGGPVATTSGWQRVVLGPVSVEVPPTWPMRSLDGRGGGNPDNRCRAELFPDGPEVLTGQALGGPDCAQQEQFDLTPTDGAWLRGAVGSGSTTVATAQVGTLTIEVQDVRRGPTARLDLLITPDDRTQPQVRLTLGVGLDASIARAIIRSIAAA